MRTATLLGAKAIWLPDHFMGFAPKWMWRPEVVAAAKIVHSMDALFDPIALAVLAARRHRRVWIGTSVTDPIRRHPMSLAQTFVTLDHLSRGRAILGIGNGLRENTQPYGFPADRRVARLEEALEIIRLLWTSRGEPVTFTGRFWQLEDAVFDLPLYRQRPPRLFIGAHFPRMLSLCGRYADGWLPGQKVTGQEYAARLAIIREAAGAAGRAFDRFLPTQTMLIAFGQDPEHVIRRAVQNEYCAYMALGVPPARWAELGKRHPLGDDFAGFTEIVPARVTRGQVADALRQLDADLVREIFYLGTPEQIATEAAPLAAAGCRHFILANMGALFMGGGARDLWRLARLIRALRRLEAGAPPPCSPETTATAASGSRRSDRDRSR